MSSIDSHGFNAFLGIQLHGERGGAYVLELSIGPQHLHEAGRVHGGVYLSLLDTVMARASRLGLEPGTYRPTLELKMNFLGSVSSGRIIATGRVIARTRQTCYIEGELTSDTGKLIARGSATMLTVQQAAVDDGERKDRHPVSPRAPGQAEI